MTDEAPNEGMRFAPGIGWFDPNETPEEAWQRYREHIKDEEALPLVELFKSDDGDWVDIFINGAKVYGNHSITPGMLLDLLVQAGVMLTVRTEEYTLDAEADELPQRHGQWLGCS